MRKPSVIVLDIEGTTTSISFVHDILFPISYKNLDDYIFSDNLPQEVVEFLQSFAIQQGIVSQDSNKINDKILAFISEKLKQFIKEDVKDTTLKKIQGILWKKAFESRQVKGHLYEDVPGSLENWVSMGIQLYIYSSGSVDAQKLLFQYSEFGDLLPLISGHFDTRVGHKREVDSYINIAKAVNCNSSQILFLSDVAEELQAAEKAGFQVMRLVRPGTESGSQYKEVGSFYEITSIFEN